LKNYLLKKVFLVAFFPLLFLAVMWLVFIFGELFHLNLAKFGILPRHLNGLPGIALSVFIHGDIEHIASNSLPILFLGMMMFFFYQKIALPAFLWIWLVSGLWLWIGGRNGTHYPVYHIGASTLVYGMAVFLFFSGVFSKHRQLMVVSALVVFLYGSMMWGIFPLKEEMSWEGHLFGALSGLLVAYSYRKETPKSKKYEWEDDPEDSNQTNSDIDQELDDFLNDRV